MSPKPQFYIRQAMLASLFTPIFSNTGFAADETAAAERLVVTATRVEQSDFNLPMSVNSLGKEQLQEGQLQVNLSESLTRIPGVVAQNRQNYAQDLQISSRGFGARAAFGVRGLRLYSDGIPATMPDGQGQVSHFDLGSAARLEMLRGPFSALYGNSSGGVIALFTEDGEPGTEIKPGVAFGSFGMQRLSTEVSGDTGVANYVLDGASFRTDGYRDHSAAKRDILNGKVKWSPNEDSHLTMTVNTMDLPNAQDALGLSRAEYDANPKQATATAYTFNTRKNADQQQLGLAYDQKFGAQDTATATVYRGHRDSTQYQAIPVATQTPITHPGGIVDLKRDYWGVDTRWTHKGLLAEAPFVITAGLSYDNLDEARKGYQNFIGTQTGVMGALRRDEDNQIFNFDQYLQVQWEPSAAWLMMAGVRHSSVKLDSKDHFIVGANLDDSGNVNFEATTPVLGVTWRVLPTTNFYATLGKGFETPTLNELSYKPDGSPGLNLGLKPAKSDNLEVGAKTMLAKSVRLNAALFNIRTQNEIVTASNAGGRATYQNVDGTRRNGFELSLDADLGNNFALAVAYTALKATYSQAFRSCRATGCTLATSVAIAAGNRMPGVPANTLYGELSWKHPASGFSGAIEVRNVAKVYVDDQNSDAAPAYTTGNLRLGFEQHLQQHWRIKEFLRVDNLADRKYAGSVIVNDGNGRFFESAPGRNWLLGLSAAYAFN